MALSCFGRNGGRTTQSRCDLYFYFYPERNMHWKFEIYTLSPTGETGWEIAVGTIRNAATREDAEAVIRRHYSNRFDCIIRLDQVCKYRGERDIDLDAKSQVYDYHYDPNAKPPRQLTSLDHGLSSGDVKILAAASDLLCGLPSEMDIYSDVEEAVGRVCNEQRWTPKKLYSILNTLIKLYS